MKLKRGIIFTTFLLLAICLVAPITTVKAATGSKYLNIKMIRNSGYGYQLGSTRKNVWKIYETGGNMDDTIYCLKGGPGFGSSDYMSGTPQETHYTRYFDLKDPDSIPTVYKDKLPDPDSDEYKALLWILDNCYVAPKKTASSSAKANAAEDRQKLLDATLAYALEVGNPDITTDYELSQLTDDDIDATQQLAVWYYTNQKNDGYHVDTFEFWLNTVKNIDGNYRALSDVDTFEDGWDRATACQALFDYLVKTPQKSDFTYDIEDSLSTSDPVEIIATSSAKVETENGRYILGPYRIRQLRDIEYSLEMSITDKSNNDISDLILLDKNKTQITDTTAKKLVGQNFYVSIPETSDIEGIKISISGSYSYAEATYWSVENPGAVDQPVVLVEKVVKSFEDKVTTDIETPTPPPPTPTDEFDLALRKFIVSINGIAPTQDRTPQISNSTLTDLKNGTITTAEKVHTKNALIVKTGDKVIYKIRIYNEGDIDGYATEVTDYLPEGLKFIPSSESTVNSEYGWTNPSGDGKTIKTNYLEDKIINAFDGTNLNYRDLEIECEVIATVGTDNKILKNVAEITAHKDKDGNTTVTDRDSQPDNVDVKGYGNTSQQDDDDFENLTLLGQYFDLSLRKFITEVQSGTKTKTYSREPKVDTTPLVNGTSTTAIYEHSKDPVSVANSDIVTYTIRVYNEGQLDGYVTEITDYLPEQLEFIIEDELNVKYGWTIVQGSNGRKVATNITSPTTNNSASRDEIYANRTNSTDKVLLKAFDGTTLDYIDVQIRCRVKENINLYEKITNIAEITGFTDKDGNTITDRDSQEENVVLPTDATLPNYKDTEIERGDKYIAGQQDDDDFEKLILKRFDLALRKFITGVNETEITNRAPVFTITSENEYKYEHTKEPVEVANGNTVIYTLRVFNEGNVSGYAEEVKDNLPEGLEFLPENSINTAFKWKMYKEDGTETTDVKEAKYIKTNYLSKANEKVENNNLIKAFDPSTMTMPDYKDLKIAFKVTEPNTSDRIIINTAEITDDADENGDEIDDVDSTPDNNIPEEDDQDIEKIKVKYFDLALKKWVTESIVTFDGKTTVTKTGHTGDENPEAPAKVEIRQDRINKTTVKFKFSIKVTNEGEIEGYVKELIDYIPEGLKFVAEDNPKWRLTDDGKVLTDQLKDVLIKPGESQTVEIILTWINGKDNMGLKTNWAEIYEDYNEYDSPDIDSTPGNNTKGEDDIDDAPVIISTATGNVPTYVTLSAISIGILAAGVILIKKFVI